MEINIEPGKYVIAISGGVDSVVLLDLLKQNRDIELVVAHYDHGIRKNSVDDRRLVEQIAEKNKLEFHYEEGQLGPSTSEAKARTKRYEFLNGVKDKTGSRAIITAHHQDDLLETTIVNLLRGTNRRGLSSMYSSDIVRPLLSYPKQDLLNYASSHNLIWNEDSTNKETKYLRNYIRLEITPKLTPRQRNSLLGIIKDSKELNQQTDNLLNTLLTDNSKDGKISRAWFIGLPHNIAREVMATWLKQQDITFDKSIIENLVIAAKTLKTSKSRDVDKTHILKVQGDRLALLSVER